MSVTLDSTCRAGSTFNKEPRHAYEIFFEFLSLGWYNLRLAGL